jgi:hypothetical protein
VRIAGDTGARNVLALCDKWYLVFVIGCHLLLRFTETTGFPQHQRLFSCMYFCVFLLASVKAKLGLKQSV